jgi:hypothetical protein
LSSAILYVAIVVIWACVLIPRWLRRDSSGSAEAPEVVDETPALASEDPGVEESAPRLAPRLRQRSEEEARSRRPAGDDEPRERAPADRSAAWSDPGHRRVVSARQRLLLMLLALTVASGVLAGTKMAAWWVIVPPSVMLLGYVLLLREAAKADAERRETARGEMDRAAGGGARRSAPVDHATPVAAAPVARVFTIATTPEPVEEQLYDQYADAKLRAVGD